MARVQGNVLPPPTLIYEDKNYDFKQYLGRKIKHIDPIELRDNEWTCVYAEEFYNAD